MKVKVSMYLELNRDGDSEAVWGPSDEETIHARICDMVENGVDALGWEIQEICHIAESTYEVALSKVPEA